MGNNIGDCCSGRRNVRKYRFTEQELENTKNIFKKIVNSQSQTAGGTEFNQAGLEAYFPESKELGAKLYKFMKHHSKFPRDKSQGIDFDTYLSIVEVLTIERGDVGLQRYAKLPKYLLLALIWNENKNLTDEQSFKEAFVSYSDAIDFAKMLIKMFQEEPSTLGSADDSTAKALVDGIFEVQVGEMDWWSFMFNIKQTLIHFPAMLLNYFQSKFLNKPRAFKLPEISAHSFALSGDLLTLFGLSNLHIQEAVRLGLIYSSTNREHNFERLVHTLTQHGGGTLIFLKHVDPQDVEGKDAIVFGGFANKPWSDTGIYSDDDRSYLFSVYPRFQNFFHKSRIVEEVQTCFTFLNTDRSRSSKHGLGFGGNKNGRCRLWLDADINSKSYVTTDDGTYVQGSILPPSVKQLNVTDKIESIEVWGLESANWTRNYQMMNFE